MKLKNLKKRIAAALVVAFVAIMGVTAVASGLIRLPGMGGGDYTVSADGRSWVLNHATNEHGSDFADNLADDIQELQDNLHIFEDNDRVQLMVMVSDYCLTSMYFETDRDMSYQEFLGTRQARIARENMQRRHRELFNRAAITVDAEMSFSFTSLINGFGMTIYYRDRHDATNALLRAGAVTTSVSQYVELLSSQRTNSNGRIPPIDNVGALDGLLDETGIFMIPYMEIDGIYQRLQGEGMVISVVDSGLDYTHPMFSEMNLPHIFCPTAGTYVIDEEMLAMRINPTSGQLEIRGREIDFSRLFASAVQLSNLTPQHTFRNHKVPFVFDYVDMSHHISGGPGHMWSTHAAHGTHVSGVVVGKTPYHENYRVTANGTPYAYGRYVRDPHHGGVMLDHFGRPVIAVRGVAPKAQLVNMQVFSHFDRVPDISILAAVHDSAILGVDAINLSLGAANGFTDIIDDNFAARVYSYLDSLGILLICATGNSSTAMTGGDFGTNLASSPDSGTTGVPASLREAFSVASMEGIKAPYLILEVNDQEVGMAYLTEVGRPNGDTMDFVAGLYERWNSSLFLLDAAGDRIPALAGDNDIWGVAAPNWVRAWRPRTQGVTTAFRNRLAGYYTPEVNGVGELRIPWFRAGHATGAYSFAGRDFSGRIALIERGINTFTDKLEYAEAAGVLGAVVHNHLAGVIRMSVEEHITIPAASISLDAHFPLRGINEGFIIIHPEFEGGPFMSDFSSWGVTPDLRLAPDITGHGGEILSAHPGGRYARNSGTSMSAPNIAGLALIYRQFLMNNIDIARSRLITRMVFDQESGTTREIVCPIKTQIHIYRMMMSTAVMPLNEHGNPYSPRRVGAGLANIRNMMRSDAWIEVPEFEDVEWRRDADGNRLNWQVDYDPGNNTPTASTMQRVAGEFSARTAINLFDDPERVGIYYMEFDIVNVGQDPLTFSANAQVFTESLAHHAMFDIIAERAHMLYATGQNAQFSVGGNLITPDSEDKIIIVAAPNDRTTVNVRIELDDTTARYVRGRGNYTDRGWIETYFPNGIYVEGFIRLYSEDYDYDIEGQRVYLPSLSVPYLAFFGDWTDAPLFEHSIYEIDRYNRMERPDIHRLRNQMRTPTQAFGRFVDQGSNFTLPIGSFIFNTPRRWDNETDIPLATESRTALSLGHNGIHQIEFVFGFLRGARRVDYRVLDVNTGEIIHSGISVNARKSLGPIVEINMMQIGARNGGRYRLEIQGFLHYAGEYLLPYDRNWEFTDSNRQFGFDFTINSSPPVLIDANIRHIRRGNELEFGRHLDLYIQSDHYLSAKSMSMYNVRAGRFESIWDEAGFRPINSARDSITRITYDIGDMWDDLMRNGMRMQTRIYDFSFNAALYEIDLWALLVEAGGIGLADIGQYTEFTSGNESINLLTTYSLGEHQTREVYVLDGQGNYTFDETGSKIYTEETVLFPDSGINIRRNMTVPLGRALVANEYFWLEDVYWHSSDPSVVEINWDGQIIGRNPGTANITVGSVALREQAQHNPNIVYSFVLPVRVLSQIDEYNYGLITAPTAGFGLPDANVFGLEFTRRDLNNLRPGVTAYWMDAGESLEVELNPRPWYTAIPELTEVVDGQTRVRTATIDGVPNTPVVVWDSLNVGIADVEIDPYNPLRATITAGRGTFQPFGRASDGVRPYDGYNTEWVYDEDGMGGQWVSTRNYIRGSVNYLLGRGFSYYEIDPGTYIANQTNSALRPAFIRVRIRGIYGLNLSVQLPIAVRPEFEVENGVLIGYNGCNVSRFTDAERQSSDFIYDPHLYGTLIVPSNIMIRHIGWGAFHSNPHITRVVLPERFEGTSIRNYTDADHIGILEIRNAAFAYMPNLREVFLPSTLQHIGNFAFAGENSRLNGTSTALTRIDFSRILAPISIGQAAFQNQPLLGTRGSHFIYSFNPDRTVATSTFVPGLIMRNDVVYVDDGRLPVRQARPLTDPQTGARLPDGDWRWHSTDGPSIDANGNITDPSDTFYKQWTVHPSTLTLADRTTNRADFLKPGAFDLTKVISIANHAFASAVNLKFVDLTSVRAMNEFAFVNFGADVGRALLNANPQTGAGTIVERGRRDVSIVVGPETYIARGGFIQSGINTPLILPNDRIAEIAFANSFWIPSIEFTGQNIVVGSEAFAWTWFNESVRFTGREIDGDFVPASVTAIESGAFYGPFMNIWVSALPPRHVNSVTELYFGSGVTVRRIESNAFSGFSEVTTLTLPSGLEHIGTGAFVDFGISTLNIPSDMSENVNLFGAFSFVNLTSALMNINVASGNPVFYSYNNTLLRRLDTDSYELIMLAPARDFGNFIFPSNITRIGRHAFSAANITEITIPERLALSEGMFAGNTQIQSVTILGDRTHIPNRLFDGAIRLNTLNINEAAVTHIGQAAFRNTAITNFGEFSSLTHMGSSAFAFAAIESFTFANTFGNTVATSAFEGAVNLNTVNFGTSVTTIGSRAFANTNLTQVVSNYIEVVHANAFFNNRFITTVNLPNAERIYHHAFRLAQRATATSAAAGIATLNIPSAVVIGNNAFFNQDRVMNVGLLDNLEFLGAEAFMNTRASQGATGSIRMPNVRSIGDRAFMNNTALVGAFRIYSYLGTPPPLVCECDENEDCVCDYWLNVYSPSIRTGRMPVFIGGYFFHRTGVYGENAFRGLGSGVFAGTGILGFASENNQTYEVRSDALFRRVADGNLELVAYPAANTRLNFVIPEGVVRIDDQAFIDNQHLRTVTMPSTLVSIGDRAFFNSNIHTFTFTSFVAPRLEAWFIQYEAFTRIDPIDGIAGARIGRQSDISDHVWAVYANFVGYFTPGASAMRRNAEGDTIGLDSSMFIFNPIARRNETDLFQAIHNDVTVSRLTGTCFGLTIVRPRNAIGFDSFIFTHYFANERLESYVMSAATRDLIERANALNLVNLAQIAAAAGATGATAEDIALFNYYEAEINALFMNLNAAPAHQMPFIVAAGADTRINQAIDIVGPVFVRNVIAAINAVPQDFIANIPLVNIAINTFNATMSVRPHYIVFVTNRARLFEIELARHPQLRAFMDAYNALPARTLDAVMPAHLAQFNAAYSLGRDAVAGPLAYIAHLIANERNFIDAAIARIEGAPLLIFNAQGGSAVANMIVFAGGRVVAPTSVRSGYSLGGWMFRGELFDFNTPITHDMTFFASWSARVTVTFDANDGSGVASQNIYAGNRATRPGDPTRRGYTFEGWYLNGVAFDFNTAVTENITLIARWSDGSGCGSCGAISTGDILMSGLVLIAVLAVAMIVIVLLRKRRKNRA